MSTTNHWWPRYNDDTRLWAAVDLDDAESIAATMAKLEQCVDSMLFTAFDYNLKLNADKTEVLIIHSKYHRSPVPDIQLHIEDTRDRSRKF